MNLIPSAEPYLLRGNRTGCLLVHGITATPREMRYLGEYLAQQGYTVAGVRLAGHATRPADLRHMRWQDWLASVEDGWHLLQTCTDRVLVMGLSMGGVLALTFAARFPVAGVIAMATPYEIHLEGWQKIMAKVLKPMSYLHPYLAKGPGNWYNPAAAQGRIAYPVNVTRAFYELRLLLAEMRASLPRVTAPTLLIHSKDDDYVLPENMPKIFNALGSVDKEMVYVEKSQHVITEDGDREKVFALAAAFAARLERSDPCTNS